MRVLKITNRSKKPERTGSGVDSLACRRGLPEEVLEETRAEFLAQRATRLGSACRSLTRKGPAEHTRVHTRTGAHARFPPRGLQTRSRSQGSGRRLRERVGWCLGPSPPQRPDLGPGASPLLPDQTRPPAPRPPSRGLVVLAHCPHTLSANASVREARWRSGRSPLSPSPPDDNRGATGPATSLDSVSVRTP